MKKSTQVFHGVRASVIMYESAMIPDSEDRWVVTNSLDEQKMKPQFHTHAEALNVFVEERSRVKNVDKKFRPERILTVKMQIFHGQIKIETPPDEYPFLKSARNRPTHSA